LARENVLGDDIDISPMTTVERLKNSNKKSNTGKRRLHFATFITKERLNFLAANHYHIDIITHANFMTGKLSAQ
jgi:hypothetical protein